MLILLQTPAHPKGNGSALNGSSLGAADSSSAPSTLGAGGWLHHSLPRPGSKHPSILAQGLLGPLS